MMLAKEVNLFGKIGGRWFEQRFKLMDEFALELDAFADGILRGCESKPSGEEGMRDAAVMHAIYRSRAKVDSSPSARE
jgi:hypothetical protein